VEVLVKLQAEETVLLVRVGENEIDRARAIAWREARAEPST